MPEFQRRRKRNSTRANLVYAAVFHGLVFFVVIFWAAHEGVLGEKLHELTVALVPPEKKPEPEPEKPIPPPPKVEPPKEEPPKVVEAPKQEATPPPQAAMTQGAEAIPAVAPAPAMLADFAFGDGAKPVETSTNAAAVAYKNLVEYSLRSNWQRPNDGDSYSAEVEIQVDGSGRIIGSEWKRGSGDPQWDESVRKAIASTASLDRPPPRNFPGKLLVRFDVLPATSALTSQ